MLYYCKINKQLVQKRGGLPMQRDNKVLKPFPTPDNPNNKVSEVVSTDFKLMDDNWINSKKVNIVQLTNAEYEQLLIKEERKKTGKHFISRLQNV